MMARFSRLVRFLAPNSSTVHYGDAILPSHTTNVLHAKDARIITGDIFSQPPSYTIASESTPIQKLLCPLSTAHIKTVRCLGLNYAQHAKETNMPEPKYPVLFYKPATAVAGPTDAIPIPLIAQQAGPEVDYECELVAIIGRTARNVSQDDALDYVLGYTVGNDVSHRTWQIQNGGSQWSLGKMFDGWAPMGPCITSPEALPESSRTLIGPKLHIGTKVNGREVQGSSTSDMIFSVAEMISFPSQGCTLLPGDLIWMGTPQGVGMGRTPKLWLKDGDVVEVALEGVGSCQNAVTFEKEKARL